MIELLQKANDHDFQGIDAGISWTLFQVKLDLEAREFITMYTTPGTNRLPCIRLTKKGYKVLKDGKINELGIAYTL